MGNKIPRSKVRIGIADIYLESQINSLDRNPLHFPFPFLIKVDSNHIKEERITVRWNHKEGRD